jgi:hypothetical protein
MHDTMINTHTTSGNTFHFVVNYRCMVTAD